MKPTDKPIFFHSLSKRLDHIEKIKYKILLVSFLILIFGNTFTEDYQIFGIVNIYQNLIAGLLVFQNKKQLRYIILGIILILSLIHIS